MTASETINSISAILNLAIEALLAAQAASQVLQQSQSEGWAEDDVRWGPAFMELDTALAAAKARL